LYERFIIISLDVEFDPEQNSNRQLKSSDCFWLKNYCEMQNFDKSVI